MTGRIVVAFILAVMGIWLLASATTEKGLLPSGHGAGWVSEVVIGLMCLAVAITQLRKARTRNLSA